MDSRRTGIRASKIWSGLRSGAYAATTILSLSGFMLQSCGQKGSPGANAPMTDAAADKLADKACRNLLGMSASGAGPKQSQLRCTQGDTVNVPAGGISYTPKCSIGGNPLPADQLVVLQNFTGPQGFTVKVPDAPAHVAVLTPNPPKLNEDEVEAGRTGNVSLNVAIRGCEKYSQPVNIVAQFGGASAASQLVSAIPPGVKVDSVTVSGGRFTATGTVNQGGGTGGQMLCMGHNCPRAPGITIQ